MKNNELDIDELKKKFRELKLHLNETEITKWINENIRTEAELIIIAQEHPSDRVASLAMKELRERFDDTYGWCADCDGLVCKEKDCCNYELKINDL